MDSASNKGSTGQLSSASSAGGGMHHSHSTPAGVDGGARTPPATPKKGGKMLAMRVQMLDDTVTIFQVQAKALGKVLFEQVCKQLHLLEADYFGLEYSDVHGTRYWLDLQKPLSRQLGLSLVDPLLHFCVKFYTPDPGQLEEEYTRYLFCLQVKRDLSQGLMQCNENTAALMASYIVQAECGDYVAEDYPDHTYLSTYKFVPQQDQEMERKIMENHKKHAGQSPAEADLNLLETARRCELYGMKMHPAKDSENDPLNLAVAHMGILVFQNYTKINTFSWAKIRKISFKRKRFLIKLHPEGYGYYKDTVEFFFEGRNECKNFWKKCVENHGFFRCSSVKNVSRHKTRVLSRGSSFRYSGKTQKQIVEFVRDNYVKRQAFQRSASFRHSSAHSSATNMHNSTVGNSISAHPLLPLADSTLSVEASKLSASLGSMGAAVGVPVSPTTKSACHRLGTATSWSSAPDTRPTTQPAQTTTSPSPPPTTHSASPTSTTPRRSTDAQNRSASSRSPLAVRAAVHRADTGIITTRTHTTSARMPSSRKSEGSLDYSSFTNNFPSQTQSQNDLGLPKSGQDLGETRQDYIFTTAQPKRHIWQRSASCRDLYDFSFEDSGQAKRRAKPPKPIEKAVASFEERKLESPVTRYNHHISYSTSRDSSLEIHQDIMLPDQKVYSSSYPGTTSYSAESVEDPGNYDLRDSQDDLSHDSYELIEKSDDDTSGDYKYKKKVLNTRSCSLDSGNYIPSDSDSEPEKRHKCKSSSDVPDIFSMDDPRDFPREIIPRKSDGTFYKAFKSSSRTSSQESKSDYYESKTSRSSKESLRKKGIGSRTSSQESEDGRKMKKNRSVEHICKKGELESRASSLDSKSEYYDAAEELKIKNFDRKIAFERNYGTQSRKDKEISHVHSVSLQNVKTEQSLRTSRVLEQNTIPRTQKAQYKMKEKTTHIWPEPLPGVPTEIEAWSAKQQSGQRSTESESNIFSFDEDKIQSLQESSEAETGLESFRVVPNIDDDKKEPKRKNYRDVFMEIEPRIHHDLPLHQPIERTKSDPNSLARQRLNSNSRRLLLMHQKSFDLTPAESSDEDYLYKQIPSAPPITKYKGSRFEMPTAEFGHFDILKREVEGQKTKFEVPKSQFEVLGAKTQSDFINLPPKGDDIPYVLHKRHIMNGTAKEDKETSPKAKKEIETESFLFTQNIDLSKVDPVTLEVDKTAPPIQHLSSPKRDITHIDPVLLETLNSKLSQIESDSPTSSKTESLKPLHKMMILQNERKKDLKKIDEVVTKPEEKKVEIKPKIEKKIKTDIKPKRVIKPRMQPGKKGKGNKTKVRITSFSSDDESLDSDDVFGSAEATPTRVEFSPPQMRKEMESILKFESERKYLQYTMSSTEVEGSPPTTRKKTDKQYDNGLDPNVQTELRRISERSFSIPSSEDDFNIKTCDLQPVFAEGTDELKTLEEEDKSNDETLVEEKPSVDEEREREKQLLQAEIENDIKNLKVPPKTKITEIAAPRRKGQSPMLFAHARLNLSEGSAFTLLQKQNATESPVPGRRAKSLDAPVIPVSRLPPLNAFSSKDDTVEEEVYTSIDEGIVQVSDVPSDKSGLEDEGEAQPEPPAPREPPRIVKEELKVKLIKEERDQIVPDVTSKKKEKTPSKLAPPPKLYTKKPKPKVPVRESSKDKAPLKALPPKPKSLQKAASAPVKPSKDVKKDEKLHTQTSLTTPEIKRTKSQEEKKEKAKSLEKLELKKASSKERSKSQEDSDGDIAKRKEKQQILYETAIKQTKAVKSPVKDILPVFPQVEEMVRERHGKLEISINTIEPNISLEEAIIITKSPKKLDKKMDRKLTKSLELNLNEDDSSKTVQRLGKSLDHFTDFDFQPEAIALMHAKDLEEASPDVAPVEETVTAEVHEESTDDIVLEGTSLDVWLKVDEQGKDLKNIEVIQKSNDFFEKGAAAKPPDLAKMDTKSSSDSGTDRVSLGNSLDIKYIDDSGDSSYKSEQDAQLMAEIQKASSTVGKFLKKKLDGRKKAAEASGVLEGLVRITSEDESLTEVSELRGEAQDIDTNFLSVEGEHRKDALQKLSIERSRSEDTGSWMTVECDEFVGAESSLDYDNAPDSPEKPVTSEVVEPVEEEKNHLLTTEKVSKLDLLKRSSDQSKSSDTGSWTSGEKDISPSNIKETDESSVSCSMGKAIGFSQAIELFATREQLEKGSPESEPPRSPRSPRICVLGRAFTIDEESISQKLEGSNSSDEANDIPKDTVVEKLKDEDKLKYKKTPYPFEEKWSSDSELSKRLHKKLSKKLSSGDKNSMSSQDESFSDKRKNGKLDKPSLLSAEKLSSESRNSLDNLDTESSSGSLGAIHRMAKSGDIPKELSSTWKPFPLESSGSESFEDNLLPQDHEQEYFLCRDASNELSNLTDIYYKDSDATPTRDDVQIPDDLMSVGYRTLSAESSIGLSIGSEILANYAGPGFLSRTLSRISERSTNSEKSSVEEESTKATTHSDSLNESSNNQVSLSSESPIHAHVSDEKKTPTNEIPEGRISDKSKQSDKLSYEKLSNFSSLLQRQISDDRRTSAEMAELSMDDIEILTSDRGSRLRRQNSDDTIIDEECFDPEGREDGKRSSSQESEDWPLPDIPSQTNKNLLALHELPSSDTSQLTTQVYQPPKPQIPKTFGLRGSLKSQDSEQWPSPPSSVVEPVIGNVETYYLTPPEEACKVTLDSNTNTVSTYDNDSNSDNENRTLEEVDTEKTHTYENVPTEHISESISESLSVGPSGVKIILDSKPGSNSDEDNSNLNDDVFTESIDAKNELRPPTALRRSTASDDSSHSKSERRKSSPKGSHSSYSEEDYSTSMGTNLEDGTVRLAFKPTRCTHSSHSEETSIALSLSEWSNSTTTVKFQNLSSNSGTTKSSSGLKSDENSLTDIAQSISEWSSSNSTLKAQSVQFQKLSSNTSDSTLTELIPTISDWANSEQQFFSASLPDRAVSRLGTSVDVEEMGLADQKSQASPKNIPSEDLAIFPANRSEVKHYTKSTERPIVIPVQVQSDTDKSSSSVEQRTVHTQRYDKDKQKYLQKQQVRSCERAKVPLKLSKCSPYYSSSLSSESTPLAGTSPIPMSKTATVPLTRIHRKPISKSLCQAKSPPSENDSTSSVESPRSKSERDRRGYRRRRSSNQRRSKVEKEQVYVDEYYYVEHESGLTEYNEYMRNKSMEEMASNFQYEGVLAEDSPVLQYVETLEEGYYPDVDSQSGSDIFRMERDEEERYEVAEGFDVASIPPPLLEDDFESGQPH